MHFIRFTWYQQILVLNSHNLVKIQQIKLNVKKQAAYPETMVPLTQLIILWAHVAFNAVPIPGTFCLTYI